MHDTTIDDLLDRLVAEFSDALAAGRRPDPAEFLARAPASARPGLERCLKALEAGLAAPAPPGMPVPGMRLGPYELVRELGRGGMALVWLARDTELDRPVAVKILRPGLALEASHAERFRREGLAVAKLRHPGIVTVHAVGESEGFHWLAMEYVDGPSLETVLAALPTDRPRTAEDLAVAARVPSLAVPGESYEQALARLLAPVAEALAAAHEVGLVHRDVKPSNILLTSKGRPVLADFGLAKAEGDAALSLTGEALGTAYYMSPEQAHLTTHRIDHRTDVYSLGVTLYEALSGHRPFGGASFLEVIEAIRSQPAPPLRELAPWVSRDAAAVVRRAMQREPRDRQENAAVLAADLTALAAGETPPSRRTEIGGFKRLLREVRSGRSFEFRSESTLLGLPLVHVHGGPRAGRRTRVARGWIAVGDVAQGVVLAIGRLAIGGLAFGGASVGGFAWGGFALGAVVCAGIGIAWRAFAGIAIGWLAIGGISIGRGAIGGMPVGTYAIGGLPRGEYVIGEGRHDDEALDWFREEAPLLTRWLFGPPEEAAPAGD